MTPNTTTVIPAPPRFDRDRGLFGRDPERNIYKFEQPWHRQFLYLLVAGKSQRECAEILGVTPTACSLVSKENWFQQALTEELDKQGKGLVEVISGEALNSLNTIRELRDDINAPKAVRLACAKEILDRTLGKSTMVVKDITPAKKYNSPAEEAADIKRQIAALQNNTATNNN